MTETTYRFNSSNIIQLADNSEGLSSSSAPMEVQLLRVGTFFSQFQGDFNITSENLKTMVTNFSSKIPATDLAIDYAHNSHLEAAGWIQSLFTKNEDTELWCTVKWTTRGAQIVGEKEYRYISSEFAIDYEDNESRQRYGMTLMGAGLTNRPFVKNMKPVVELSEQKSIKENGMEEKLKELMEKLALMEKEMSELKSKLALKEQELGDVAKEKEKMLEEKKLAEKESTFNKFLSEGKVVAAQKEAFMKDDFTKFTELAMPVKLKPEGSKEDAPNDELEGKTATDKILKLADDLVAKEKISVGAAIKRALAENQDLAKKYYEEKGV